MVNAMFLVIYFIVTSEYLYHHGISYTWLYYTRSKKGVIVIKEYGLRVSATRQFLLLVVRSLTLGPPSSDQLFWRSRFSVNNSGKLVRI